MISTESDFRCARTLTFKSAELANWSMKPLTASLFDD